MHLGPLPHQLLGMHPMPAAQVRRMCYRSKLKVQALHRRAVAGMLRVESVPQPGDVRWLSVDEIERLRHGVGLRLDLGEDEEKQA